MVHVTTTHQPFVPFEQGLAGDLGNVSELLPSVLLSERAFPEPRMPVKTAQTIKLTRFPASTHSSLRFANMRARTLRRSAPL